MTSPVDRARIAARVAWARRARGFPWTAPTWPGGLPQPPFEPKLGASYDTQWARAPAARVARALVLDGVVKPAVAFVASPTITGLDRLARVEAPAIFTANHASHIDTFLLLTSLPERFRHRAVVAAAADYFFDRRVKAVLSSLALAAIPIDRTTVSRSSLHRAEELVRDGWSLIIFPEGGRTPDGWAQEFRVGAAYIATRCDRPVIPVHLAGSRQVWRKGGSLHRASTAVTFGAPLPPGGSLGDARRLATEIEQAVAVLADEHETDWWSARRRAASRATPSLRGPEVGAWRRSWTLREGERRPAGVRWP